MRCSHAHDIFPCPYGAYPDRADLFAHIHVHLYVYSYPRATDEDSPRATSISPSSSPKQHCSPSAPLLVVGLMSTFVVPWNRNRFSLQGARAPTTPACWLERQRYAGRRSLGVSYFLHVEQELQVSA